ncbi:antiviral reverse transcriptase Drt3a [Proteiniphilum acetatigenes]|uniref:antiviral reverse transcriptase Drt3a n=1 Tax=Proteiniphilum acetatigenes TaxID=294710 RepID=UPI00037040C1|nr:antiviral reverse transcriptase Drt3a [Proteiniphilum acetatigenes]
MLDQSFTADNFETIYDIENRKNTITEYLGTEYKGILNQIKSLHDKSTQIKRKKSQDRTEEEKLTLIENKQKKEELILEKKKIRHDELEKISKEINSKDFKFDLLPTENDVFIIQDTREAFFAIKQLQYNVRKTFNVKQSSRHLILSQIKLLLNDSSPKYIIRTDVSKFFESIIQDKLLRKISNNTLLNTQSKKFIRQIIEDYNRKKDPEKIDIDKGVPRGVGISSYLSELYMKDIDNQIRNMEDVIYYARYVDDIFIIISPKLPKKDIDSYFTKIKDIVSRENLSLKDNGDDKCSLLDLSVPNMNEKIITYLGYALYIKRNGNKTSVLFGLSDAKKEKIRDRITKCFQNFNNTNKYGIKNAKKDLLLALRFSCSNTKLSGAKSRVKTGIFHSNYLLDKEFYNDIFELDDFLKTQQLSLYNKLFPNESIQQLHEQKIKNFIYRNVIFEKGFKDRTYHIFSKDEMKTIKKILQ